MKRFLAILVLFAGAIFLCQTLAQAESVKVKADEAVIIFIEGDVKVKAAEDNMWIDAAVDMVLSQGYNLKTGPDSWAELGFGEKYKNVIKIKESTTVELIELGPVKVSLLKGEIRSLVEKLGRNTTFEIRTPTAVCGARGTGWDTATDGTEVIVDAYENEVYFYPLTEGGADPIIKAGKRGILKDPARPITIRNIPIDKIRNWNRWKGDFRGRRSAKRQADRRSKGGGKGVQSKVQKMQKTQKNLQGIIKGKEKALQSKDQEKIETRSKDTPKTSNGTQYP